MATHRIVLDITDEEFDMFQGLLEILDSLDEGYADDWSEDEEPRAELIAQYDFIRKLRERIVKEF